MGMLDNIKLEKLVEMTVELFDPPWGKRIARILIVVLVGTVIVTAIAFAATQAHKSLAEWFPNKQAQRPALQRPVSETVASSTPASAVSAASSSPPHLSTTEAATPHHDQRARLRPSLIDREAPRPKPEAPQVSGCVVNDSTVNGVVNQNC